MRDLAGLIVIDFIDMEEHRNQIAVERRLKEALKNDRARIQVGRISPFGLLEMSRQRLRPSLTEASTQPCPHCGGTGFIRSVESTALYVLRSIEEEGIRRRSAEVCIYVPTTVALYILNQKRESLAQIETRYGVKVMVARWPTKSIISWTNAGASLQSGSRPRDKESARRDCLEASAGQLADDLGHFFKSQGG